MEKLRKEYDDTEALFELKLKDLYNAQDYFKKYGYSWAVKWAQDLVQTALHLDVLGQCIQKIKVVEQTDTTWGD